MSTPLQVVQFILAIIVIVTVLLQVRNAGVGSALGGSDSSFYASRRGIDRVLFNFTIGITALFFLVSVFAVRFQ